MENYAKIKASKQANKQQKSRNKRNIWEIIAFMLSLYTELLWDSENFYSSFRTWHYNFPHLQFRGCITYTQPNK